MIRRRQIIDSDEEPGVSSSEPDWVQEQTSSKAVTNLDAGSISPTYSSSSNDSELRALQRAAVFGSSIDEDLPFKELQVRRCAVVAAVMFLTRRNHPTGTTKNYVRHGQ